MTPKLRFRSLLGIDQHLFATLLFRGWSTLAGASMVLLVPFWLDRVEQGYYYTLLSLLAVQIFFELGLNQIVVQLVSHEVAHLDGSTGDGFSGDPARLARLASLIRLVRRWYALAATLFATFAIVGGGLFLASQQVTPLTAVIPLWLTLVAISAGNLFFSPSLAVLEGCGQVDRIARLRLVQSLVGYSLMWAGFALGLGLWAIVSLSGAALLISAWFVLMGDARLGWLGRMSVPGEGVSWRREVLPLQWRTALSWISGYFIMQTFVPMTFAHQGPVAAGRLGITLTVFAALQTLGMSWFVVKMPVMTGLISRARYVEVRRLFKATALRSAAFVGFGGVIIIVGLQLLPAPWQARFAEPAVVACAAVATLAMTMVFAGASFMRAHLEEPMVAMSTVLAAVMIPAVFFGSQDGVLTMMALYVATCVGIALPWTAVLLRSYWRRHPA